MNSVGIYLHVPFCRAKCAYCDFYSLPAPERIPAFEKALMRAIRAFAPLAAGKVADTVYFGGGTPSLLSAEGLAAILDTLRASFSFAPEPEITVEVNPESADPAFLACARSAGVNRVSIGMQSAIDSELSAIGRIHRADDTRRAAENARAAGFDNLSLDLMYGLPGQTVASFTKSLEVCAALSPRHVSFYCLTLSPSVPLYRLRDSLPGEEETEAMFLTAHRFLEARGFEHYEISNAALPGFRSRHNTRYWTRGEYLGVGPAAHSFLNGERFCVRDDLAGFLSAKDPLSGITDREKLTPRDAIVETVMLSLRRKEGLDLSLLRSLSDEAYCRTVEQTLADCSRRGLCRKTAVGYALTPRGFFVSNAIISRLIP